MFDNIGGLIKKTASIIFGMSLLACCSVGIYLMVAGDDTMGIGLSILLGGPILCWFSYIMAYGFGQLVENSDVLVAEKNRAGEKSTHQNDVTSNKMTNLVQQEEPQNVITPNTTAAHKNTQKNTKTLSKTFVCGKCGRAGDYTGNCPDCGSTMKKDTYI